MEHESKTARQRIIMLGILTTIAILIPSHSICNNTKDHSKERYYQLKSMELGEAGGKWNFHPGLYYVMFHKDYSGGKGFFSISFKESRSNVKSVSPRRVVATGLEAAVVTHVQSEIDSIKPLAIEEDLRTLERVTDDVYGFYKPFFDKYIANINESLNASEVLADDEMYSRAQTLHEELGVITEHIEYIHKQGPTYQLEQAKRDLAYSEIKGELEDLSTRCSNLYLYAKSIYNLYH